MIVIHACEHVVDTGYWQSSIQNHKGITNNRGITWYNQALIMVNHRGLDPTIEIKGRDQKLWQGRAAGWCSCWFQLGATHKLLLSSSMISTSIVGLRFPIQWHQPYIGNQFWYQLVMTGRLVTYSWCHWLRIVGFSPLLGTSFATSSWLLTHAQVVVRWSMAAPIRWYCRHFDDSRTDSL